MAVSSCAWAIGYSYNSNASLATLTYPSGLAVSYTPNALGQPTRAGSYATGVSYYPNGAIKQFSYGNGIVHTLAQNTRGLPARSTDCTISGTCALANRRLDLQYAYDGHGNVTAITDHTSSAKQTRGMSYDGLDRLTQTTSPTAVFNTASYSYDQLDNLLTVNVTGGSQARNHTYVYDATTKRLSQVKNTVGGAIIANLTWDVQGNLASKGPSGAVQSFQFDLGNRLRSVPNKETGYEYDGHGRRVYALTVGSSSILSQYANSGQVLYQQNNKQSKRIDYIYLGNSLVAYRERPLASSTETLKYQHTDALGSPIAVTNTAKTTIESSEYEPFGQIINKPLFDGPGYTGHVQDAATGLTYMQQRYYDAGIGRFLSVDPVTAYSNPVGAFNRYWYANNNPYRFTDPDGRIVFLAPLAAGAARCAVSAPCRTTVTTGTKMAARWARDVVAGAGLAGIGLIHLHNESSESQKDEPEYTDTEGNKPPFKGKPGSTVRGGTGSRKYGDDGYPETDRDTPHPDEKGQGNQDHVHDWSRPEGGGPPRSEDRGPSREPKPGDPPEPRGPNVPPDMDKLRD